MFEDYQVYYNAGISHWMVRDRHQLTLATILMERDPYLRRLLFELAGPEDLLEARSITPLDADEDISGHPRKLYLIRGIPSARFIDLMDWSGHWHKYKPVPRWVRTCQQAVAWRRGAIDFDRAGVIHRNWDYIPGEEG